MLAYATLVTGFGFCKLDVTEVYDRRYYIPYGLNGVLVEADDFHGIVDFIEILLVRRYCYLLRVILIYERVHLRILPEIIVLDQFVFVGSVYQIVKRMEVSFAFLLANYSRLDTEVEFQSKFRRNSGVFKITFSSR
jgi:hypothetical protein